MVAPTRRRSTRQEEKEKEKEREKQPSPPPPESPVEEEDEEDEDEDEAEEVDQQSDVSEEPVLEQPKKRRGRPPRNVTIVDHQPVDEFDETESPAPGSPSAIDSPSSMPRRRGRGRPSTSGIGGRGRGTRGGPSHATNVPNDKFGNEQPVKNNEIDLPEDPAGEMKVDKDGNLLGGRQYRCRTFTMMNRGEQLYMLSTEPARCAGFRDSYLFFQRHKQLYKIICNDEEKFDLIKRNIIPHSYKGRAIGVCTARSVFREFGARMIVGGRRVSDDYYEQAARDRGDVEGEIADPEDRLPPHGTPYNQNQYVAWHGASSVYHTSTTTAIAETKTSGSGGLFTLTSKKKKLTEENWMAEVCQNTAEYNKMLTDHRARTHNGIYEPHTNAMHFPAHFQPTAVRIAKVSKRIFPPDEFFDAPVPQERRKYPPGVAYSIVTEEVAPPVTLNFAPGDYVAGTGGGLISIDPSVYEDQPPHIKAAILEQISKERAYLAHCGIKPPSSH